MGAYWAEELQLRPRTGPKVPGASLCGSATRLLYSKQPLHLRPRPMPYMAAQTQVQKMVEKEPCLRALPKPIALVSHVNNQFIARLPSGSRICCCGQAQLGLRPDGIAHRYLKRGYSVMDGN